MKSFAFFAALSLVASCASAQVWKGKRSAVVLTYDDAINAHLDNVIPALDSFRIKGTFYLIGSSPVTNARMSEWRTAAANGHELGNHGLVHPCDGSLPGRGFVTTDNDLSKYTVTRAVNEIRLNNTLLKAIDGKTNRTYAYPCGDKTIGGQFFFNDLRGDFACARGVKGELNFIDKTNLDDVNSYSMVGHSGEYMIDLVKNAVKQNGMVVFLFHGVGGGHNLNVELKEHSKLLHYLKEHEKEIWITTMVDAAEYIKKKK